MTDITPKTRRICVAGLGVMGVATIISIAFGGILFSDGILIILPIITGLFALINGGKS